MTSISYLPIFSPNDYKKINKLKKFTIDELKQKLKDVEYKIFIVECTKKNKVNIEYNNLKKCLNEAIFKKLIENYELKNVPEKSGQFLKR